MDEIMDETVCTDTELRILTEKCRKYQGTAKIKINQMTPHPSVSQHTSTKNVERLCQIFDKEGCRRLDINHSVSAVVSRQHIHEALQAAGVNVTDLLTDQPHRYPHLDFSAGSIKYLHGQHRLGAGEQYLPSVDQWWTVDLYLDDISPDLQTSLVDEYSNERVPTDGEIYVKVRQYRNEANSHFENRWLARLSDNKARRLRGLESHPVVRAAFDSLLAVPSLLIHGMQIGSLPQALAICCDEEMVHALTRLLQYWSSIVGQDRAKMLKIDTHTVETLQLLAPGVSSKDRITVKGFVHSGEVFSSFTASERASIWKRLKRTEGIIPSLFTFFKDLWYLESCANCIKQLITPSRSFSTIRSAMRAGFLTSDPAHSQSLIQTSETGFRSYSHSQRDPAEVGYRQLWLFAMRHYPKLSKISQKKDPTAKPTREVAEPMILYDMAVLAKRLGFQSPQIEQLIQQSPDRKIAQDALLRARRPDRYRYNEEEVESLISKVTECFLRAIPLNHQLPMPIVGGRETKKESRCGHPQIQAQLQDSQFLFIDKIHCGSVTEERKATSFLVRRSVYFTFFSKLPIPSANGEATGVSPNPDLPMSPLFISNDRSSQDQEAEEIAVACTEVEEQSSLERQRLKDVRKERRQQKRAKKLRRRQQRKQREQRRHQSSCIDRHSIPSQSLPALYSQSSVVYSEGDGMEEALKPTAETESRSAGSGGTGQGAPDMQPFLDELEHGEPIGEVQSLSEDAESEGRAELGFEKEQLRGGSEEIIAGGESVEDADMQEHASVQGDKTTKTAAQLSSAEEFQKALDMLEGRGPLRTESGPSRVMGRTSAAMRERAKFKPYDRTQRHQRTSKLPVPPQETPELDSNTLSQMVAQEQTAGRITQIDFLEAQHRPLSGTNDEQSSRPMANQSGLTQDHQQAPEETLSSVEFDPQPEFPRAIDQNSRRYGLTDIQSEPEEQRSESGPPAASPHLHIIADGAQQDKLTERPSWSPPRESSTQPYARTRMDNTRSEKLPEEQDRSPGRREGGGDITTRSAVTIMFRARDEHGEWNRLVHKMVVDPLDVSPMERMTAKQARAHQATYYDRNLRQVPPGQCLNAAVEDGTNTIFMTFGDDLAISEETVDSITRALEADRDDDRPAKRKHQS